MKILILGFGLTGRELYKYLVNKGEKEIYITDKNKIEVENAMFLSIKDLYKSRLYFDICLRSPGIPIQSEMYLLASLLSKEVINDIEFSYRELINRNIQYICITGTNGKTTLTKFIGHCLNTIQEKSVYILGNIGVPMCSIINDIEDDSICVLELSSFQIENLKYFKSDYSLITNISPNHLDVVLNYDFYKASKLKLINHTKDLNNVFVEDDILKKELNVKSILLNSHSFINNKMLNKHYNFTFSFLAKLGYDISNELDIISSFKNERFRQEEIVAKNILFINDSKSTNVESLMNCLENYYDFKKRLIIIGGIYKSDLIELVKRKKNDSIVTFGKDKDILFNKIHAEKSYNSLQEIFLNEQLINYDIVIFSPACSSFDQYKNYIDRGLAFDKCVNEFKKKI